MPTQLMIDFLCSEAIEFLHQTTHRRSVSFIISDFRTSDFERPLRLVSKTHDIIPVSIDDPRERNIPNVGLLKVQDLETGTTRLIDTANREVRKVYGQQWEEALARRRGLFYSLGMDTVELNTDQPYFPALLGFFRRRQRRLTQGR